MAEARERLSGTQKLEAILGLLGTLNLMASAITSHWYNRKGLWEGDHVTEVSRPTIPMTGKQAREVQLFFIGLSSVMAATSFCLCLVFLVSWKPPRHLQDMRPTPSPGTLLIAVLLPTGIFFFLGWTVFTWQHWEDIQNHHIILGYSYWIGATAWTILLLILPITYIVDECTSEREPKSVQV